MKKILLLIIISFFITNISFSKITNVDNKFNIDIPNNFTHVSLKELSDHQNIDDMGIDFDVLEDYGLNAYIIGDKKILELLISFLNGDDLTNNKYIKPLIRKFEKKAQSGISENQYSKWMVNEIKKALKKEKISGWIIALASNDLDKNDLETDLGLEEYGVEGSLLDLNKLSEKEFKKISSKIKSAAKKELKNYNLGPMTISIKTLDISKDKGKDIFLSSTGKVTYALNEYASISGNVNLYITVKNKKLLLFYEECIVNCSSKNFQNLIKPVKSQSINIENDQNTKSSLSTETNDSLVEEIKKLSELYKSGVLTKEEFEKAKKKLLN